MWALELLVKPLFALPLAHLGTHLWPPYLAAASGNLPALALLLRSIPQVLWALPLLLYALSLRTPSPLGPAWSADE